MQKYFGKTGKILPKGVDFLPIGVYNKVVRRGTDVPTQGTQTNKGENKMITTYEKDSKEYQALKIAAAILTVESPTGVTYKVEETYFDYGAGMMWTTIVAHRANEDSWQALDPKEQKMITESESWREIADAVKSVQNGKYNPDRVR